MMTRWFTVTGHRLGDIHLDFPTHRFAVGVANWRDAEECIQKYGATTEAQSGYEAVSPHVTRAKNHLAELIKLQNLLGLSPSARTRIEVSPQQPEDDGLLA